MSDSSIPYHKRFFRPWPRKSRRVECVACGQEYPTAAACPMCGAPALLGSANDAEIPDEFRAIVRKAI
jgi:hypothetical protein